MSSIDRARCCRGPWSRRSSRARSSSAREKRTTASSKSSTGRSRSCAATTWSGSPPSAPARRWARSPRSPSARARPPSGQSARSVVRRVDRQTYGEWLAAHDDRLTQLTELVRSRIDRQRAIALITELLAVDGSVAADVVELADWVRLEPGESLFAEGDESDAGYLVVSGRLTVSRRRAPRRRGRSRRGRRRDRPDRTDRPIGDRGRPARDHPRPLQRRRLPQPRRRPPGADAAAVAHDPGAHRTTGATSRIGPGRSPWPSPRHSTRG